MGLKLTVGKGDQIIQSNGVVIEVKRTGREVQLDVTAPKEVKVHTIFKDPSKQFKNLKRDYIEAGQQLSPEEQRAIALNKLKRK